MSPFVKPKQHFSGFQTVRRFRYLSLGTHTFWTSYYQSFYPQLTRVCTTGRSATLNVPWRPVSRLVSFSHLGAVPVSPDRNALSKSKTCTRSTTCATYSFLLTANGWPIPSATVDTAADKSDTDVWMASLGRRPQLRMTSSPDAENAPRWSPDGNISRSFPAGRAVRLADPGLAARSHGRRGAAVYGCERPLSAYDWSPDSNKLLLTVADRDPASRTMTIQRRWRRTRRSRRSGARAQADRDRSL